MTGEIGVLIITAASIGLFHWDGWNGTRMRLPDSPSQSVGWRYRSLDCDRTPRPEIGVCAPSLVETAVCETPVGPQVRGDQTR